MREAQQAQVIFRTLLVHSSRNIRRGGLPFFFSTMMIGLGLFALATFVTILINFQNVAERVGSSVGAVAFLDAKDAVSAEETRLRISLIPGVARAQLIAPQEAMQRVTQGLGEKNALLSESSGLSLPWVIEIGRALGSGVPADTLFQKIEKVPGIVELMHAGAEVKRLELLTDALEKAGVFLAILIGLVTLIVVSNTVKLTVLARSEEIAIMKLVGATDFFVRFPFLIEGLVQGLIGSVMALSGLFLLHASIAGVLRAALSDAFATFTFERLPTSAMVWMIVSGALLGLVGATLSVRRFLRV